MKLYEEALARFCQELGVDIPLPVGDLIHLESEQFGALQFECHHQCVTLWLKVEIALHAIQQTLICALSLAYRHCSLPSPLRCSWVGESTLLLFITLDKECIDVPLLRQAFVVLTTARSEVLSA